jgi:CP family cyanate transporter-like MFS transporter
MIGLRARTSDATAVLSGFVQSVGYTVAAVGPLTAGVLYDLTGAWDVPLAMLALLGVPMLVAGLGFAKEQYIEDQVLR